MPRRRSIYSLPKLKLKQKTIVTVATIISFIMAALTALSLGSDTSYLSFWKLFINEKFGWTAVFTPILFALTGFVLLKVKWSIGQLNVLLGLLLIMLSLSGLSTFIKDGSGGEVGLLIWGELKNLITSAGAAALLLGIFSVGVVVFLNTSFEQIMEIAKSIFGVVKSAGKVTSKVGSVVGVFKRDKGFESMAPVINLSGVDEKAKLKSPTPQIQREAIITETLVQNVAGQTRVWKYPPVNILSDKSGAPADRGDVKKSASIIEKTLDSFGIQARVAEVNGGPAVTQYALEIAQGTKIAKIANLQHDLALSLATRTGTVRVEAPIPGKSLVGIEVPNHTLEIVTLKSVLTSDDMKKHKSKLAVALGKDTASRAIVVDIDKMPHSLIAGTTGSGKSVLMHSLITSLIFRNSPDELKLILIDPKRVEMSNYNDIPHLLAPVIVEPEKILSALKWATGEMDRRYKLFQSVGVRNIQGYNELSGFQALPYICIFIDELADLMMFAPAETEDAITRLAQLARATGIHLVIATQRPSVDIITGLMKANIPCRIAFNVSSQIDSRVILDGPGAEKLLGRGDMLFLPPDASKPMRIQGVFLSDAEINGVVKYLKDQGIAPQFSAEVTETPITIKGKSFGSISGDDDKDDFFQEAVKVVCQYDKASASLLQRRLKVGYARAARIMDELESAGVIGPGDGAKPREVLVKNAEEYLNPSGQQAL